MESEEIARAGRNLYNEGRFRQAIHKYEEAFVKVFSFSCCIE